MSSAKHRHYEKTLKSSGKCSIYGKLLRHTNKVSLKFLLRDTLHEPLFTGYQEGNIIDNHSMLQFCDRLTLFEDAIHQIAKLTSDGVEVKCLTQADIESILFTLPPISITYNRRSKVVENVSQ